MVLKNGKYILENTKIHEWLNPENIMVHIINIVWNDSENLIFFNCISLCYYKCTFSPKGVFLEYSC